MKTGDASASPVSLSKNLVEFAPAGANKVSICFVRWRVHRTKHKTPGKCEFVRNQRTNYTRSRVQPFQTRTQPRGSRLRACQKDFFDKLKQEMQLHLLFLALHLSWGLRRRQDRRHRCLPASHRRRGICAPARRKAACRTCNRTSRRLSLRESRRNCIQA